MQGDRLAYQIQAFARGMSPQQHPGYQYPGPLILHFVYMHTLKLHVFICSELRVPGIDE